MKKISTLTLFFAVILNPSTRAQSTYNDVADIFYNTCTYCHHNGGIAPFSLMNYIETSSFSNSIHASVSSGSMPPWQPDTAYTTSGRKVPHYLNENVLTEVERNQILTWITDGALEGDPELVPKAPIYGDVTYRLNGNPDLTLQIPDFRSNASPNMRNPYNCFSIPTNLTEDRWLRAFEVVPGNLEAVHHVVVTIDTTGTVPTDTSGRCTAQGGEFGVGGWTPGTPPVVFPSKAPMKAGIRIPAGSNFIIQMHYAPGSDGKLDNTKIRLFFYPEDETGIRPMHANTLLQNWGTLADLLNPFLPAYGTPVEIKANSNTPQLIAQWPKQPTQDFTLYSVSPHSHSACTKIKNYAFKGTDTIPLISIPNWDFNWEGNYFFPKPIKIPGDYMLESWHLFDNTLANKHIERADRVNITWGTGTEDEMLFDAFLYLDYQAGDEDIDLKSMIEGDSLFTVGIDNFEKPSIESYIFPNPATDNLTVYLSKSSVYQGVIYNLTGQVVLETATFVDKLVIDLNDIPSGLYILELIDTKTNEKVSKKIVVSGN